MTRVLLVDDHLLLRDSLRPLLKAAGFDVVGEAADGQTALRLAVEVAPDVVVLDITLPDLSGIDVTRQLATMAPNVRVLALSMHFEPHCVTGMLAAGAAGYVVKDEGFDDLVRAIKSVARGQRYLSASIADVVVGEYLQLRSPGRAAAVAKLTPRERDVLRLLADGKCTKEIAAALQVSVKTVESFRRLVMDKLNIHSIAGLTKYAIRVGLSSVG